MTTSRFFGEIDASSEYVETTLRYGGGEVRSDVNLAAPGMLAPVEWAAIDDVLDALAQRDAAARAAFAAVMDDDAAEPAQLWRFQHDEVEGYESLQREDFVAALQLRRVGFYPDGAFGAASYLVMDYVLPGPPTDQILVAKVQRDGSLLAICWES